MWISSTKVVTKDFAALLKTMDAILKQHKSWLPSFFFMFIFFCFQFYEGYWWNEQIRMGLFNGSINIRPPSHRRHLDPSSGRDHDRSFSSRYFILRLRPIFVVPTPCQFTKIQQFSHSSSASIVSEWVHVNDECNRCFHQSRIPNLRIF